MQTSVRGDLLETAIEGVLVVAVSRESAKAAARVADVGEVDVPIDDEGDLVADVLGAGDVRRAGEGLEVGAVGLQQQEGIVGTELAAREGSVQHSGDLGRNVGKQSFKHQAASCRGPA
jgi:hypothetical protein